MALTLRTKAQSAVFSYDDGVMRAEWTLRPDMTEAELLSAMLSVVQFVKKQPIGGDVIHLHAVADHVEEQLPMPRSLGAGKGAPPELSAMTWRPAVQPKPLDDSLEAASQNGFELIPEGE